MLVEDGTSGHLVHIKHHLSPILLRYAMERTSSFIKVWFWSRNDGNVPSDVKNGATNVNTDSWVSTSRL